VWAFLFLSQVQHSLSKPSLLVHYMGTFCTSPIKSISTRFSSFYKDQGNVAGHSNNERGIVYQEERRKERIECGQKGGRRREIPKIISPYNPVMCTICHKVCKLRWLFKRFAQFPCFWFPIPTWIPIFFLVVNKDNGLFRLECPYLFYFAKRQGNKKQRSQNAKKSMMNRQGGANQRKCSNAHGNFSFQ